MTQPLATAEDVRRIVLEALGDIAPDADLAHLDPKADLREATDIDSMDFLNFVTALHRRLGVVVPEADYPQLATLAGMEAYLMARARP